jgi:DNA adenine methylase
MWAGGKNKMIPKYLEHPGIPTVGYDTYVEPFFGGGAMMIWIHENSPTVKRFVLNDINTEIVGIYQAIKTDVVRFTDRMDLLQSQYIPMSKADRRTFYYDLRKQYATNWTQWSATDESATLYFLMKTAFNGIWQTTKEANGRFCTPCGLLNQKTTVYDQANVMEWYHFLQKVTIWSGPWQQAVTQTEGRTFYFFDPPYRDSFTQYGTTFDDQAHIQLIDFCKQTDLAGNLVMYCNRMAGPTDTFYTNNQGHLLLDEYDIKYTAGRRATEKDQDDNTVRTAKSAREILLYSPAIRPSLPQGFEYEQ